jgi:hypothetical protein
MSGPGVPSTRGGGEKKDFRKVVEPQLVHRVKRRAARERESGGNGIERFASGSLPLDRYVCRLLN